MNEEITVAPETMPSEPRKIIKGLGGWLILVGLGLIATGVFFIIGLYEYIALFGNGTVDLLNNPSSEMYIAGYKSMIKFEMAGNLLIFAFLIYLLVLFFEKNKRFPNHYIAFFVSYLVFCVIDYFVISQITVASAELQTLVQEAADEQIRAGVQLLVILLVWGSYMKKSKRVRETFVETYPKPKLQPEIL